jgi:hypothetical protein
MSTTISQVKAHSNAVIHASSKAKALTQDILATKRHYMEIENLLYNALRNTYLEGRSDGLSESIKIVKGE